jgi:hypothetical protein
MSADPDHRPAPPPGAGPSPGGGPPPGGRGPHDLQLAPLPGRVVAAAYVLALVTLLIPLAFFGAVFAGVVLMRRDRRGAGAGVIAVGIACFVLGMTVVWSQL